MNDSKYICDFPPVVRIEPSATCNLSCIHCPTGTLGNPVKGNMKSDLFNKIIEEIKEYKLRVVVLYMGGEPFLNKDFFSMVEALKKINIPMVKTVSNGTLLNKEIINAIIKSDLDLIEFSLDGTSGTMNDFIRKKSSFETICENIKCLLDEKEKLESTLKVVISSTQFKNAKLESQRPNWLYETFQSYIDKKLLTINYVDAIKWSDMYVDSNVFDVKVDMNDKDSNFCDHVINTITIRHNGDIVPCCYDLTSQLIMGNVLDDKLKNIWNNQKYINLRKSIDSKNFISICKSCSVVNKNQYLVLKENIDA